MGLFHVANWTNKGILVSDNEIACNWILKKIYNTHWHSDRILSGLLIGSYPGSLWDPTQNPDRILPRILNCRN